MKWFTWTIVTCYIMLFILLGVGMVAFSLQWLQLEAVILWIEAAYQEQNLRLALFLTGAGLILLNWIFAQMSLSKAQRQKTIAFDNPDGRVTVSLSAIEDFVRKAARDVSEVKELRSDVVARKGRIVVRVRAVLWSEAHIPAVAERVQSVVRSRVQEMLSGIEEPVTVTVHVAKIVHREGSEPVSDRKGGEKIVGPFRGM